ncbi:TPA: hypothetical protein DEP90_01030, partial [Patescibacteria group bacterium]|nr:hypothetical protein [Patescibacteria group bacterium]
MPTTAKRKRKVSKRTIIIASILTVLIGVPLAIYLITKNASTPYATWYNSSWNYRRSVTITNTHGSTLYDEDVLITVDTATLITATKLQADCGDLRFVDDNDVTVHTYWIEGGCNTATTQIWVRIPELPNGESIIYMYYDNSTV